MKPNGTRVTGTVADADLRFGSVGARAPVTALQTVSTRVHRMRR